MKKLKRTMGTTGTMNRGERSVKTVKEIRLTIRAKTLKGTLRTTSRRTMTKLKRMKTKPTTLKEAQLPTVKPKKVEGQSQLVNC